MTDTSVAAVMTTRLDRAGEVGHCWFIQTAGEISRKRNGSRHVDIGSSHYRPRQGLSPAVSDRSSFRAIRPRCEGRRIISKADVGGLHHRYERRIKVSSALRRDSIRIGLCPCAAPWTATEAALVKRRKRPLSADDAGRVTSEAALSKHPKCRGSRPITT